MPIQLLSAQIEGLRSEMIRLAEHKGSLIDPQVIEVSQQLDQLLVMMQRLQKTPASLHSDRGTTLLGNRIEARLEQASLS